MVDLRRKYEKEIALLKADAQSNEAEATQKLQERLEEVETCKKEVKDLKETAKMAHKAFLEVIKGLGRLAFIKDPDPEEVKKVTEPCTIYANAAGQKPIAEERLEEAKNELAEAQEEMYNASAELSSISFFG